MDNSWMNSSGYSTGVGGGGTVSQPSASDYQTGGPQMQQLGSLNQQQLATAQNQVANGQSLTPQVANAAQNDYATYNQEQARLNTPGARQDILNNTNLGAAQSNYDSLAKQLASYDNMVLQPQFAGQNPGMPTDLPNNPDVYMGNVSYLTPGNANLPANQGIYNANPTYALTAQNDQRNSIVSLLGTLNDVVAKEQNRGTARYSGNLKATAAMLDTLNNILGQNTQLTMKKTELANSKASALSTKQMTSFQSAAKEVLNDFQSGKYSTGDPQAAWGKAWNNLRTTADTLGLHDEITNDQIDSILGGGLDKSSGDYWGNASNQILQDIYLKGRPVAQQNTAIALDSATNKIRDARNEYNKAWSKGNPLSYLYNLPGVGQIAASYMDQNAYNYIKDVEGVLGTQIAKGIGGDVGALANRDIDRAKNEMATLQENPEAAKPRLDRAVMYATMASMRMTKAKSTAINPATLDKVQVDTPEELEQVFNQGYTLIQ